MLSFGKNILYFNFKGDFMKKPSLFKTCILLWIITFISSLTGYVTGFNRALKKPLPSQPIYQSEVAEPIVKKSSAHTTAYYLVKEEDGLLAIFSVTDDGSMALYNHYDASISLLPKADREALAEGIKVQTLSDALQLVEDFCG